MALTETGLRRLAKRFKGSYSGVSLDPKGNRANVFKWTWKTSPKGSAIRKQDVNTRKNQARALAFMESVREFGGSLERGKSSRQTRTRKGTELRVFVPINKKNEVALIAMRESPRDLIRV